MFSQPGSELTGGKNRCFEPQHTSTSQHTSISRGLPSAEVISCLQVGRMGHTSRLTSSMGSLQVGIMASMTSSRPTTTSYQTKMQTRKSSLMQRILSSRQACICTNYTLDYFMFCLFAETKLVLHCFVTASFCILLEAELKCIWPVSDCLVHKCSRTI